MAYQQRDSSEIDKVRTRADAIFTSFGTWHAQCNTTRDLTRRRVEKGKVKESNHLITVKSAKAYNRLMQLLAFVCGEIKPVCIAKSNAKGEDKITGNIERFLTGVPDVFYPRVGDYIYDGNAHLIESGAVIYYLQFNTELARNEEFPFDLQTIDPVNCAWQRGNHGVSEFVVEESRLAGELYDELRGWLAQADRKARAWSIPEVFDRKAQDSPETSVGVVRHWDRRYETMWIDDELVWSRPHMMGGEKGRLPFVVGTWGLPGDKPNERALGFIAPVIDDLENQDRYLNLIINYAEYQFGQLATAYDQAQNITRFVQITPGSEVVGQAREVPFNPSPGLFEAASQKMDVDVSEATAPTIVTSGGAMGASSGFQAESQQGGFRSRMDMLLRIPERVHGELYGLLLSSMEYFADTAKARRLAGADSDAYMRSFTVSVPIDSRAKKKAYSDVALTADDIQGHTRIVVSMKPNLPNDQNAKIARVLQVAQSKVLDRETIIRDIYEAEKPDEILDRIRIEELVAADPDFAAFYADYRKKLLFEDDPELRKEFDNWAKEQLAQPDQTQAQPGADMGQQGGPGMPPGMEPPGPPPGMPPGAAQGISGGMVPGALMGQPPMMPPGAQSIPLG